MNDWIAMWVMIAVSAVVVLYVAWQQQRDHAQAQRRSEQQDLVRAIQRDLESHKADLLARCSELHRKVNELTRTAAYIAKRVS